MVEAPQELRSATQWPHNLEAERALLGGLILDKGQIDNVLNVLPASALRQFKIQPSARRQADPFEPLFFSQAHQLIFGAIMKLHEENQGVDLTTLAERLLLTSHLEAVGGSPYLATLEDDVFALTQVPDYARIVAQKWRLRCLLRATQAIAGEAVGSDAPAEQIIDMAEKRIFDIAQEQQERDFIPIGDAVADQLQEIEDRLKSGGKLPGLSTGFRKLDEMTTGLRPAQLIIVAARPSMGKTALAMNIAANVANKGNPVGIFSLEMSANELTMRMLCTQAHVSMGRVRGGKPLRRDEQEMLHEAGERLALAPIHIDDASSLTIIELRARARRLKARCPDLALIVVDYLQLMNGGGSRYDNRQQEVSEISRSLKGLARELEVPVVALSQLSRQSEQRRGTKDKLPRLSDLRESGAIEQDADIVIFIHRERTMVVPGESHQEPDLSTIRIGKQRNGPIGDFEMLFRGEFTEFVDLAPGS